MIDATPLNFVLKIRHFYDLGWSTPRIAIETDLPLLTVQTAVATAPRSPTTWAEVWGKKVRLDRIRTNPLNDDQAPKLAC